MADAATPLKRRAGTGAGGTHLDLASLARRLTPFVVLALTVAIASSQVPNFFTLSNLSNVARQSSFIALLVLGQSFVLIYGGFDLSVGSLFALAGVLAAYGSHVAWPLAFVLPLAAGLASGALNGHLIGTVKMAPFIVTLAELLGYSGLALAITNQGNVINVHGGTVFTTFSSGNVLGVDNVTLVMVVLFVIGAVVLNRTRYGAALFAVGGNQDSARMLGVPVRRVVFVTYMLSGALAAFSGALFAGFSASGQPTVGTGYELQSIAAAVVGGCALTGGVGTVSGPLAGALVLGVIQDFVNLDGHLNDYTQNIVYGVFIVLVVVLQKTLLSRQQANREARAVDLIGPPASGPVPA
jgi:ribose/xylose/arabinose/galactoside ABC-type transport system permease subunit